MSKWLKGDGFQMRNLNDGVRDWTLRLIAWVLYKLDRKKLDDHTSRAVIITIWGTDRYMILGYGKSREPNYELFEGDFDAVHAALDDMVQGLLEEEEMERRQRFTVVK